MHPFECKNQRLYTKCFHFHKSKELKRDVTEQFFVKSYSQIKTIRKIIQKFNEANVIEVHVYNLNEAILNVILTIEKHHATMAFLGQTLSGVKNEVQLHQIIGHSEIGLTLDVYTEMLEGIRKEAHKLQER